MGTGPDLWTDSKSLTRREATATPTVAPRPVAAHHSCWRPGRWSADHQSDRHCEAAARRRQRAHATRKVAGRRRRAGGDAVARQMTVLFPSGHAKIGTAGDGRRQRVAFCPESCLHPHGPATTQSIGLRERGPHPRIATCINESGASLLRNEHTPARALQLAGCRRYRDTGCHTTSVTCPPEWWRRQLEPPLAAPSRLKQGHPEGL